mmetsp:Transcript_9415/g.17192  ORF Transcript_9415/g.17192 Transcript_9415/m.17192 type:complete len:257 (+) Transcript_9415:84-854(+)
MELEQPKKVTGGAFGRYMAEHRAALLKETSGKPATASIKLGSERFKALSESERQKYQQQYEEAKQQYEKDLAAFNASGGEMKAIRRKGKKEKKEKDPNKPKKPTGGAFGCFLAKNRTAFQKECPGKPVSDVAKIASERWRSLSDADKKPFESEYQEKKTAYEVAMKDYVPPAGTANYDDEEQSEDEEVDQPSRKKPKTTTDDSTAKAKTLGYARQYAVLIDNPKVKASGASPSQILEALKAEGGKVVPAKKALLGA